LANKVAFLLLGFKFIHSLIPDISIAPLQVYYYSEALPTTALIRSSYLWLLLWTTVMTVIF